MKTKEALLLIFPLTGAPPDVTPSPNWRVPFVITVRPEKPPLLPVRTVVPLPF
jgi:hypothetical protein